MSFRPRLLACFDQEHLGFLNFATAKELVADWVDNLPAQLLGFSPATATRDSILRSLRLRYTSDVVEYQVADDDLDDLTLAALRDNLCAFVRGWRLGHSKRDRQLLESL